MYFFVGGVNIGNWLGIADDIVPYPMEPKINLTSLMHEKVYFIDVQLEGKQVRNTILYFRTSECLLSIN